MEAPAEPKGAIEQAYASLDQPPCLSLLNSLDETLQQLKDICVDCCGRPDILPSICAVYDDVRFIIGDLRRVCLQQLRNSHDIMDLLSQLAAEREMFLTAAAGDQQLFVPGDGIPSAESERENPVQRPAGGEPSSSSSSRSREEDRNVAAMRNEILDLRSKLVYSRVQLQNEIDARQTAQQHIHLLRQKDILQRIALQDETDKVRIKNDQVRILEMVIQGLRQTATSS